MSIDALIATRLLSLRQAKNYSLAELAKLSGVSKAMISKIERNASSPSAAILGRLAAGLGVSLAKLLAEQEAPPGRLRKQVQQDTWRDPLTGYLRRQLSLRDPATGIEMIEVELPPSADVNYPPWHGAPYRQRLWLLEGALRITYGSEVFELQRGDYLDFGVDRPLAFHTLGQDTCRYLIVSSAS
ncbi:helix-turn-helix domain-containing protein [Janthinobacterium agaricidamnosum]|uniref:Helix-turn-helix family protein n=1 Tax=Janthinobacterium agaricidamnosum NBRC 102515 = DSM 9628 TaxID=1349767 RepID=W0VF17_9BURK|nr:XRE family transcriptional regulator [Janthinobacterium agaricidamnosum]CDG86053.1 helix-turn-helix family protein [Janthinobacterium agaricidamnosum NBRC 102515 = DSM 9628]